MTAIVRSDNVETCCQTEPDAWHERIRKPDARKIKIGILVQEVTNIDL
jgi:hypothetical protein